MQILQHFFPERDLTLQTLKGIASNIYKEENIQLTKLGSETSYSPATRTASEAEQVAKKDSDSDGEKIAELHDQVGCLMEDSLGEYRRC